MKRLEDLKAECAALGLTVETDGRPSKQPWIEALRTFHWERENSGMPLPPQIEPMLLSDWKDLDAGRTKGLEHDHYGWIVQEKKDGVRALLHVQEEGIRITGRCTSEVTYRLTEHQANLPHLNTGLENIGGTILDGELVCPISEIDTETTVTATALQAAVAILAASPDKASRIQQDDRTKLRLHVFDVLSFAGVDVTDLPLHERLGLLSEIEAEIDNPYIEVVPSYSVNKGAIHHRILERGGEGTVWKHADLPYEPGRRVKHWVKRKRELNVEAFITGFKPGKANHGHSHLVGAVEFSVREEDGTTRPVAWVSTLPDAERLEMTKCDGQDRVTLNPDYLGRKAVISGQDMARRSERLRHARIQKWLGEPTRCKNEDEQEQTHEAQRRNVLADQASLS